MKKKYIGIFVIIFVILLSFVGIYYFGNTTGEHLFKGIYTDEFGTIRVDVVIMRNNNGNLLMYNTDVMRYSEEKVVSGRLIRYENNEKKVILGNNLGMYDYARKNENKKEYGEDYIDIILKNKNSLYFDLCFDHACENIFKTIQLDYSKLN